MKRRCAWLVLLMFIGAACCIVAQTGAPADSLTRAKSFIDQSRFPEAEKLLRDFLAGNPSSPDATYMLAYVLFRRNEPAQSLSTYTAAAALKRPNSDDFKIVGLDYVLLNDYPDAIRWLEKAVQEDPKNAEAAYHLGRACYTQNWFDRALAAFQQALRIDPRYGKAENNLGLTWAALNRLDLAEDAYRKAIRMDQVNGKASEQPYINLAELLINHNRIEEALAMLNAAKGIEPRSEQIEQLRGRALLAGNKLAEAEAAFRAAVEMQPGNGVYHYQLGRVLKREGREGEAKQEFERSRALLGTHSSPPPGS